MPTVLLKTGETSKFDTFIHYIKLQTLISAFQLDINYFYCIFKSKNNYVDYVEVMCGRNCYLTHLDKIVKYTSLGIIKRYDFKNLKIILLTFFFIKWNKQTKNLRY